MKKLLLITLIIISLNCCNRGKMETKKTETEPQVIQTETDDSSGMQTESLVNALNNIIGISYDKRAQLMNYINGTLEYKGKSIYEEEAYGYYGIKYSYKSNGKYLFVTETEFGGGGSSFENIKTYIYDTELIKLITPESIFINANAPSLSFHKLVIEYILKNEWFNPPPGTNYMDYFPKADDPIIGYGFCLFYSKDGIGLKWSKGAIAANAAGSIEIVLPYSKANDFLTQTGKEVFK